MAEQKVKEEEQCDSTLDFVPIFCIMNRFRQGDVKMGFVVLGTAILTSATINAMFTCAF